MGAPAGQAACGGFGGTAAGSGCAGAPCGRLTRDIPHRPKGRTRTRRLSLFSLYLSLKQSFSRSAKLLRFW